ncbi:hypothetical protein LTR05_007593 [Lithohypha guttulata]|uniref:Uncharacterized protein n=1 Tax=Lithohypha guttulata TaxID=1690604 RepID=A0AAN7SVV9_9EURO|nr:hypothetical protein LTR05_007593 [Lithohypha guttulata]
MKELNRAHDEILSKKLWRLKPRPTKDVLREPSSLSTPRAPPSPGTEGGLNAFLRAYKVPGTPAPASSTPYKPYSRLAASSSSSADYKIKSQSTPDNSTTPFQLQNFAEYTILLANFIESKLHQPNSWPSPAQTGPQPRQKQIKIYELGFRDQPVVDSEVRDWDLTIMLKITGAANAARKIDGDVVQEWKRISWEEIRKGWAAMGAGWSVDEVWLVGREDAKKTGKGKGWRWNGVGVDTVL